MLAKQKIPLKLKPTSTSNSNPIQGSVATAQPAVCTAQPAVCTAQPAVCTAQPAASTAHPAVCTAQPAVCTAQPAVCTAQPAVTKSIVIQPKSQIKPKIAVNAKPNKEVVMSAPQALVVKNGHILDPYLPSEYQNGCVYQDY